MANWKGCSENISALLTSYKEDGTKLTRLELSATQLTKTLQDMTTARVDFISDQALNQLKTLLHVGQDTLNDVAQDQILRGIKARFQDISYHYQVINDPFKGTFKWIFDLDGESPEASQFTQ